MLTNIHKDHEATVKASHVTAKPFTEDSKCFRDSEFMKAVPCLHY
jgi:hypothetical protein